MLANRMKQIEPKIMNVKLAELAKGLAQSALRRSALKKSILCHSAGYPLIVLMTFNLLVSHAQPIQPEVLFEFPYGIGSYLRGPEYPYGNLVEGSNGSFYGTTSGGGSSNAGTVFKVSTNGVVTSLFTFNNTNGAMPQAGLALGSDGDFYGTTSAGGSSGDGTVFKITTDGTLTSLGSLSHT